MGKPFDIDFCNVFIGLVGPLKAGLQPHQQFDQLCKFETQVGAMLYTSSVRHRSKNDPALSKTLKTRPAPVVTDLLELIIGRFQISFGF